jgi:uncharacterized alkaline shock family protein YloU
MDFVLATSSLGRVAITDDAVAQIVGLTTVECYGVVGMVAPGRLGRLLPRDARTRGVEVSGGRDGVSIGLHVVVEHGLNLAEVASTLRDRVTYEVGRMTGLPIAAVEVHIEDVKGPA